MSNQVCLKQETFDQLLRQALSNCSQSSGNRGNRESYQNSLTPTPEQLEHLRKMSEYLRQPGVLREIMANNRANNSVNTSVNNIANYHVPRRHRGKY